MKVSIITVCYNSAQTIRDTIESVLSQTYTDIEYIIVDGSSKDDTLKIINSYGDKITKVISEPDKGIYDAMNKGIALATGDVVAMLNSDDFYINEDVVGKLMTFMKIRKSDCVFADLVIVDSHDTRIIKRHYDSGKFAPKRLANGWMPAHPTFFVKTELYREYGNYSLDFKIASDFEMMVRLFKKANISYAHFPEVVVKMRSGGMSNRNIQSSWTLNTEIVRACKSNGIKTNLVNILFKIIEKLFYMIHCAKINQNRTVK